MLPKSETRVEGDPQVLERPPHLDLETPRRQSHSVRKPIPRTMESTGFRFRQRHPQSNAADDLHRRVKSRFGAIANLRPLATGGAGCRPRSKLTSNLWEGRSG